MSAFNNAFCFTADDRIHGSELWRLDPLSALVRLTTVTRQGNNISLNWTSPGGFTNIVQAGNGARGAMVTHFTDCSGALVAPTGTLVGMSYVEVGTATNTAPRFYRIRIAQ